MTDSNPSKLPVLRLLLEATAIFAGVTLGFLADDYRDYRNARAQERESVQQVLEDLRIDAEDMAPIRRQAESIADLTRWISNGFAEDTLPSDSLLTALDSLSQTQAAGYEPSRVAFTGLRSTGRLDLIQDDELRRALVAYFEDQQPIVEAVGTSWQQVYFDWWDSVGPYLAFFPNDRVGEGWPRVRAIDREMLRDRGLRFKTLKIDDWSRVLLQDIEQTLTLNDSLSELVRSYLDGS